MFNRRKSASDRSSEISAELLLLYRQQAEFFGKGTRVTQGEVREYEKRRQLVRDLFEELTQLKEAA
jgi:hypothetical protein